MQGSRRPPRVALRFSSLQNILPRTTDKCRVDGITQPKKGKKKDVILRLTGYRFLEHMTDAEIECYGKTLEEAFENAARALEDTMVDVNSIEPAVREEIVVEGEDRESLLYSWLEALINKQDIDGMLYSDIHCKISTEKPGGRFTLKAAISGEKFDPEKHEQKTAVKSPTYHAMQISDTAEGVTMRFLLDL